uniref:Non-ribosomal peptide synthetase, NRPS-like protein n=1 Tax=Adineta vaga TaxID=104782 RepID=B3G4I0_ADIVA|nr:non-ribosomal peptide synthetase, NRPS-like protein [Adineta vaga]
MEEAKSLTFLEPPLVMTNEQLHDSPSFDQQRTWFNEQDYLDCWLSTTHCNMILPLIIKHRTMSIGRIHSSFKTIIRQHNIFRGTIQFNEDKSQLEQIVQPITDESKYLFEVTSINKSQKDIDTLLKAELTIKFSEIDNSLVVRCHLITMHLDDTEYLQPGDLIIFTFHRIVFHYMSFDPFLNSFLQAYSDEESCETTKRSFDYVLQEHEQIDNSNSKINHTERFWSTLLESYNWNQACLDSSRFSILTKAYSIHSNSIAFILETSILNAMIQFASFYKISMFELCLACYFTFLHKLTNQQNDNLIVISPVDNQSFHNRKSTIDTFINLTPYQIKIESENNFVHLMQQIHTLNIDVYQQTQLSYNDIVKNGSSISKIPFYFQYKTNTSSLKHEFIIKRNTKQTLLAYYVYPNYSHTNDVTQSDLSLIMTPDYQQQTINCILTCSSALYDEKKLFMMVHNFQHLLKELFYSHQEANKFSQGFQPIRKLTLFSDNQINGIQDTTFHRLPEIIDQGMSLNDYDANYFCHFKNTHAPVSYAQSRIWQDEQVRFMRTKEVVAIHNMPFLYSIPSDNTISITKLRKALEHVVMKHPSLRTSIIFDIEKNELIQKIMTPNGKENLFIFVESNFKTEKELSTIINDEYKNPNHFNLASGCVFRCHIARQHPIFSDDLLSKDDIVIFNFHHAIFDFYSMDIFNFDLNLAIYGNLTTYDEHTNLRYFDYAVIQRQVDMSNASSFWFDALRDYKFDQLLTLPFDQYRVTDESRSCRGTSVSFDFGEKISQRITTYASTNNTKVEYIALAIYYVLLFKITDSQQDLCVSANAHGRYRAELMSLIGVFINVIPLRCQMDPNRSFNELVDHVHRTGSRYSEHSYFPLQRILELHVAANQSAFLDIYFGFESIAFPNTSDHIRLGNISIQSATVQYNTGTTDIVTKFDLSINVQHDLTNNQLSCVINGSSDLFSKQTVYKIGQRFILIMEQLFEDTFSQTKKSIYELSSLMPDEAIFIRSIKNTDIVLPTFNCLQHEFVYQAKHHNQKLAIELDEQSLTYTELLYYVQKLALHLIINHHLTTNDIVCQCIERSLSMVIGILSIEIAGSAYCPLSARDPEQRLNVLIHQTQSPLVLIHHLTQYKFNNNNINTLDIDTIINNNQIINEEDLYHLSNIIITPESIAYVIFTSGSTGIPKAVQVRHQNFIECIHSLVHINTFTEMDTIIQMARCSFDIHMQDIVGTLVVGGTLVMLHPKGNMDFEYLTEVLKTKQITFIHAVPTLIYSLFQYIKETKDLLVIESLRTLCASGEAVSTKMINFLATFLARTVQIWDLYGPAETTLISTYHLIDPTIDKTSIPIGRPLPNYTCFVHDEFSQPISIHQVGELIIGGVGVFAGYLGRDDLTANALVNIDGEICYKTGDLVRLNENGLLDYLGRKDNQVKLRGQRIELNEIEQCLLETSITACVVIKWKDDYLVAYVQNINTDVKLLREHCLCRLPSFMVPSMFIVLEEFPLNANGKIDRKRLPTPDFSSVSNIEEDLEHIEPKTKLERRVHSLWCKILGYTQISTNTSISSIGGHSLLLTQLYHSYRTSFNIGSQFAGIMEFFEHPTIADHARLIEESITSQECDIISAHLLSEIETLETDSNLITENQKCSRYENFPTTEIQQAYLFGRNEYVELGHVSCFSYEEYDYSSNFNILQFEQAFNCLIGRHETLRIIFPCATEQKILKDVPYYRIVVLDLSNNSSIDEQLLKRRIQLSHQVRPVDQWPLFDIQLTRFMIDEEHQLRLHIGFDLLILDLWSLKLILSELNELYLNINKVLASLDISYRDYILAELKMKETVIYRSNKEYWMNRLTLFPLGPNMPLRCSPTELKVQRFCRLKKTLDRYIWQRLKHQIHRLKLSPAGFLASVYSIVLSKWSENKHFSLNLPIFNRSLIHPQVNEIAGDFTSILPLEINLDKSVAFEQFARTVQNQLWNDLEHMLYNGVSFIRELMCLNNSRQIILPIIFTCGIDVDKSSYETDYNNILFDKPPVYGITQTPQVFLDNQVHEHNGHLIIHWDYVDDLFPPKMVSDMLEAFIGLLHRFSLSEDIWHEPVILSIPIDQHERRLAFNQTKWTPEVENKLLHTLISKQAAQVLNAPAVFSSRGNLTYEQLMNYTYSLANHLREHGAQNNQLIAIFMEKGWEQIVACLAVLFSGAAFLPLDIDSPQERLLTLVKETDVKIILTQSDQKSIFLDLIVISVDIFTFDLNPKPFPMPQQLPTDLAYIIFTSGSTGKPKGVMISHQAVINTILDLNDRLEISAQDRIFALSHLNFDLSVYDIFGTLIAGGAIVMCDQESYKNPKHWYEMMVKYQVTIWNSVPMLMQMLVEFLKHTSNENQLRHILLSGDWIPLSLPKSIQTIFGDHVTVTSLGGATEGSIWSIAYSIPKLLPNDWKSIPYGIPLRNQEYYVYDIQLNDCPEWVTGELYIGGLGLADGYWKDKIKTESSFILHPRTNQRLYRTGDYGRFLPNGYIEFIGRTDFQVKLHGHRIELGEIEYCLQQFSNIRQAIVNVDDKSKRLIAYITTEKHHENNDDYNKDNIFITDPTQCDSFKLMKHNILRQDLVKKNYSLNKLEHTDTLIDTYYIRKSYRQFTNEIITEDDIENLLRKYQSINNGKKVICLNLNSNTLSQFLSVLRPITILDKTSPKYRYASAGSLYPVQVYIEVFTIIDDILPGFYYYNPDNHNLQLISTCTNNDNDHNKIHLHLIGRSAAIAPIYGKKLGSQLCVLETGYMMGLLKNEALKMGWIFSKIEYVDVNNQLHLNLDEHDTHHAFSIQLITQDHYTDNDDELSNYPECIVYFKASDHQPERWFIYDRATSNLTPFFIKLYEKQEEPLLFFENNDENKVIFNDCRVAIFFIGHLEQAISTGMMAHVLMEIGVKVNIGMCPVSSHINLPSKITNTINDFLTHSDSHKEKILLHTLLLGKINPEQKYEHRSSVIRSVPNYSQTLTKYLSTKLPSYMVPSLFITVSKFPLNVNGKIDRKALQNTFSLSYNKENYEPPISDLERTIVGIWQKVLNYKQTNPISITAGFFSLGGYSLLLVELYNYYQSVFDFDTQTLTIRSFFQQDTIAEHAKMLQTTSSTNINFNVWKTLHIIEGRASFAQERIYLDAQIRNTNNLALYNELIVFRLIKGSLSKERLERAICSILNKHPVLRTSLFLSNDDGMLMQSIKFNCPDPFKNEKEKTFKNNEELDDIIRQTTIDPNLFDLSNARVFHYEIVRYEPANSFNEDYELMTASDALIIAFHHAAFDLVSSRVFLEDLTVAYNSDKLLSIDEDSFQYIDYSIHEHLMDMTTSQMFWRSQLEGYNWERPLLLPANRYHNSTHNRSSFSTMIHYYFDDNLSQSFLAYASLHGVTPFHLGIAIFYVFLFKLNNDQNDFCVTCLNANRHRTELRDLIGMFVATLPYRIQFDPRASFNHLMKQVFNQSLSILQHSHYPLQQILANSSKQEPTTNFLKIMFDLIILSQNLSLLTLDGAQLEQMPFQQLDIIAKFDMTCRLIYDPSAVYSIISCSIICSEDIYDQITVQILMNRYVSLFQQLFDLTSVDITSQPVFNLSIILPDELNIINVLNINHDLEKRTDILTINESFYHQTFRFSQKLAIELDDQSLTYTELLYYVQKLALHLINNHHLITNAIICQCIERSLSMVIGILSIEIAGSAYCPLSARDPEQRLNVLIEQTQSPLVLIHHLTQHKFNNSHIITLDIDTIINNNQIINAKDLYHLSNIMITSENIAYVIFTSGSTGTPKAVQVRHRNFIECIHSLVHINTFTEMDTIIQMARCSFDIHMQDIVGTLIVGGTLVMLHPKGNMDFEYLAEVLKTKQITFMHAVPTLIYGLFQYIKETKQLFVIESLREALTVKQVSLFISLITKHCRIWNLYGPAETTLVSTYHLIDPTIDKMSIPIGRPLPNYTCFVHDEFSQPVSVHQVGELIIGGVGVFAGYLGRDDLTANALVNIDGKFFYRTGDLVRLNENGLLDYLGRKDNQVKLRGQRIELNEIEQCLLETSITACIVIKWKDDHLVAYVQCVNSDVKLLREHCLSRLPSFMVPSMFIVLEEFPLNANGKIDRKRLQTPDCLDETNADNSTSSPSTPLEHRLQSIFTEVLNKKVLDKNVSLGAMGGTSLDAMRVLVVIRQQIYTNVDAALLFANPSVGQLARAMEPLLSLKKDLSPENETTSFEQEKHYRPMPSLFIEGLGIILLFFQWIYPLWMIHRTGYYFALLLLPLFYLLTYIVWQHLLLRPKGFWKSKDELYSWRYYRMWFLNRLWSINNSYWLQCLMGTPFYNVYLRMCGAKIGYGTHIYTTLIDAPWLLEVGDSTFIGEEVILSSLSYQDQTYKIHSIHIGANCSIGTRSVLYDDTVVYDHVHKEPLSRISGHVSSPKDHISMHDRSFTTGQTIFQLVCILSVVFIHGLLLVFTSFVYCYYLTSLLFLPASLALCWLIWTSLSLLVLLLCLRFVVGEVNPGCCSLNSYYYLRKVWLRRLVISSFYYSLNLVQSYDEFGPVILRWLGAHIEDDVRLAEFQQILNFPSNLLKAKRGATTFAGATLAPFEVTHDGKCRMEEIHLGSDVNLGNWCVLMPGTQLTSRTIVGSLTRVTRETNNSDSGTILLGIPASIMPFMKLEHISNVSSCPSSHSLIFITFLSSVINFLMSKYICIIIYSMMTIPIAVLVHTNLFCAVYYCSIFRHKKRTSFTYSEVVNRTQQFLHTLMADFFTFLGPFLSETQFLVFLYRILGARIGRDVIVSDISCLTDPHLVTIGDHVRLNRRAYIQVIDKSFLIPFMLSLRFFS